MCITCKNPKRRPVHMWCPPPKESILPLSAPCSTVLALHVSASAEPVIHSEINIDVVKRPRSNSSPLEKTQLRLANPVELSRGSNRVC